MLGLMRLDILPLPADPVLLLHLALVALLMIVFPISKLLHAPGLFFSPTRNQADTSREARHLAAWAAALRQALGQKSLGTETPTPWPPHALTPRRSSPTR